MKKIPNVVLLIERDRQYGRDLLSGIADYSRHFGPWSFVTETPFYINSTIESRLSRLIEQNRIDGIIMRESPLLGKVIDSDIPLVLCPYTKEYYNAPLHLLTGDDSGSGTVAAEHLLGTGLKHFAFCGISNFPWSDIREKSFIRKINEAGYETDCFSHFSSRRNLQWPEEKEVMAEWLNSLNKPAGIMSCTDDRSQHLVEACKTAGLKIPDDIAIVGVDNDILLCELSNPALSSICLNTAKAGYEAASLLSKLMNGEKIDNCRIKASVSGVKVRESTNIISFSDKNIHNAITFIRANANRLIGVDDVVASTSLSRRSLEIKFTELLNSTIYDIICKTRVDRIAQILTETDYPVSKIAIDLGYSSEDHIARFFKKEKGITPLSYRKKHRI